MKVRLATDEYCSRHIDSKVPKDMQERSCPGRLKHKPQSSRGREVVSSLWFHSERDQNQHLSVCHWDSRDPCSKLSNLAGFFLPDFVVNGYKAHSHISPEFCDPDPGQTVHRSLPFGHLLSHFGFLYSLYLK